MKTGSNADTRASFTRTWGVSDSSDTTGGASCLRDTQKTGEAARPCNWGTLYRNDSLQPLYEGSFRQNRFDGQGTQRLAHETYFGYFRSGERHGRGMLRHADGSGTVGWFERGTLVKTKKQLSAPPSIAHVLYLADASHACSKDAAAALTQFQRLAVAHESTKLRAMLRRWRGASAAFRDNVLRLQDRHGATALHTLVLVDAERSLVEELLRMGATPHLRDNRGATPLHYACGLKRQSREMLLALFSNADFARHHAAMTLPSTQSSQQHMPASLLRGYTCTANVDLVDALLLGGAEANALVGIEVDAGAKNSQQGNAPAHVVDISPLEMAALNDDCALIERLMQEASVHDDDRSQWRAILLACFAQRRSVARRIHASSPDQTFDAVEALLASSTEPLACTMPGIAVLQESTAAERTRPTIQRRGLQALRRCGLAAWLFDDDALYLTFQRCRNDPPVPSFLTQVARHNGETIIRAQDGRHPRDAPDEQTKTAGFLALGHVLGLLAFGFRGLLDEETSVRERRQIFHEAKRDAAQHASTALAAPNMSPPDNPYIRMLRRVSFN